MAEKFVDISALGNLELARAFGRMEEKLQKKTIRKALRKGAKLVKKRAETIVAQRFTPRSGALATGVEVKAGRRSRSTITYEARTKPRDHFGIDPGDPYYYPAILEFGSPSTGLAPHPYLRPAADQQEQAVLDLVEDEVDRAIRAL